MSNITKRYNLTQPSRILTAFLFLAALSGLISFKNTNKATLPKTLTQNKDNVSKFENQGKYHSTYLLLSPDSSFLYYSVFEVGYNMSTGKYFRTGDTLTFNWDSIKTYKIVADSSIYKKYFHYGIPSPYKITGEKYKLNKGSLNYIENTDTRLENQADSIASKEFESKKGLLLIPADNYLSLEAADSRSNFNCGLGYEPNYTLTIICKPKANACSVAKGQVTAIVKISKWVVMVKHGNYFSVYPNLDTVYVKEKQIVNEREKLGLISTIDNKTILEFQLWKRQNKINPDAWVAAATER